MNPFRLGDGTPADRPDPEEQKVVRAVGAALIISTIFFTVLHHGFPQALNVPPPYFDKTLPPGSLLVLNPDKELLARLPENSFALKAADNSCLLEQGKNECAAAVPSAAFIINTQDQEMRARLKQMNAEELPASAALRIPVPMTGFPAMFALDLLPIALAFLCFYHAWRRLGLYRAMLFLGGSFVFTGLEESMWILLGRFHEQLAGLGGAELQAAAMGEAAAELGGTYYFTRGFFWFLETPLLACLGWFFVAYACVYVAELLIPKANIWLKAALGGLLAMDIDLWIDPVQTHNRFLSWIWAEGDRIEIFSIPLSNFLGWFLLIFLFAIVFDKVPAMTRRWGPKKAALYFYLLLLGLELGILFFFILYGSVAFKLLPEPLNFTVKGIGAYNLKM